MEVAMLGSMFQSSTIPLLEQAVKFTEARHGVLAGNIANLDTPGYRTRDLSPQAFQQRLKEAINTRYTQPTPTYEGDPFAPPNSAAEQQRASQVAAYRDVADMKNLLRHDENDVSLEQQVTEIAKNQQQHNLAISIMSAQFRLLRAAITERVV
jgi:flagellar basal-body rod protein FlgB